MKKIIFEKIKNFDDKLKNEILIEIEKGFNENNDEYYMIDGEIMPVDENNFNCNKYDKIEKDFLENIDFEIEESIESLAYQYEIRQTEKMENR